MYGSVRFAGIDIGSNAIRLLIANVIETPHSLEIAKNILIRIPLRLGEDVFAVGKISNEKTISLINSLNGFKYIMKAYNVIDYKACATSAMREASNNKEVMQRILEETDIKINLIDGETEAAIIFSGSTLNISNFSDYMYVDVGGGSTEITVFCNDTKVDARSFKLGTVRMLNQGENEATFSELTTWLKGITQEHKPIAIIGTGGNINKVQKLLNKKNIAPLSYSEIKHLHDKIQKLTIEERIKKMKMVESRADVIIPAMHIFLTIMETAQIDQVFVPKAGLADGIIRQLHQKHKSIS